MVTLGGRFVRILALAVLVGLVGTACKPAPPPAPGTVPIMGASRVNAPQLVQWFGARSPGGYRATVDVGTLATFFVEEGAREGVRGDIAPAGRRASNRQTSRSRSARSRGSSRRAGSASTARSRRGTTTSPASAPPTRVVHRRPSPTRVPACAHRSSTCAPMPTRARRRARFRPFTRRASTRASIS